MRRTYTPRTGTKTPRTGTETPRTTSNLFWGLYHFILGVWGAVLGVYKKSWWYTKTIFLRFEGRNNLFLQFWTSKFTCRGSILVIPFVFSLRSFRLVICVVPITEQKTVGFQSFRLKTLRPSDTTPRAVLKDPQSNIGWPLEQCRMTPRAV